ncbi:MAG: acetylxylan esterase [Maribacter sp.]|nr:MAG: acetylxylan esterase [Maribacter sp.]
MKLTTYFLSLLFIVQMSNAQSKPEHNYDESKVPEFQVPDPLTTFNGAKVSNSSQWLEDRRPELYSFFEENVYGKVPGKLDNISFEVIEHADNALNGMATRKQIRVTATKNNRSLNFTILLYLPKGQSKAPVFLGHNFLGNHTVNKDSNIIITKAWVKNTKRLGITDNRAKESSRGVRTNRWAIEKIIAKGFALATIYYGEIDPDKDVEDDLDKGDFTDGIHPLFYEEGQQIPKANEWGSIAAWAWGLSRALDYFETDSDIDATKVIAFGHSRLGKASLWAAATDQRFAAVISNNSGCGGAALSKRKFGETLGRINRVFPHWFSDSFNTYNNNEEALPIDQHQLLSLIAPRPLYVASAIEDRWSDPRGEFLSAHYATAVYNLFDKEGISSQIMPEVDRPIQHTVAYHIRTGKHDVTDYDWEQYIKWAKEQL